MRNYWVGVVSRSHVKIGVKGGFIQLNHGKKAPLERLKAGDMLAMYSPRESYPDGPVLQAFTAIGTIKSGKVYQVEMSPEFQPSALTSSFRAPGKLRSSHSSNGFPSSSKTHWGGAFRFGYVKVPEADFARIADAMKPTSSSQNGA